MHYFATMFVKFVCMQYRLYPNKVNVQTSGRCLYIYIHNLHIYHNVYIPVNTLMSTIQNAPVYNSMLLSPRRVYIYNIIVTLDCNTFQIHLYYNTIGILKCYFINSDKKNILKSSVSQNGVSSLKPTDRYVLLSSNIFSIHVVNCVILYSNPLSVKVRKTNVMCIVSRKTTHLLYLSNSKS